MTTLNTQQIKPQTTKTLPSTTTQRRYDIDALRVLAVVLLIYFHTAMIFAAWETWHVRSNELSIVAEWFIIFVHQWHMPLLFLLAGASTYFALQFRTGRQYAGERIKRLFVPFVVGVLIIVPPQVYIERISSWMTTRISPIDFTGSFLEFYPQFFQCCYSEGNLSWHHLWFVFYLLVYSLIALPLFLYLRTDKGISHISGWAGTFSKGSNIFWLALPIVIIEITMRHRFPHWQDLIHDWTNNLHFMLIFIYGYVLFADSRFQDAIDRNKKHALILGLVATVGYFGAIYFSRAVPEESTLALGGYVAQMGLRAISEWGWILAFLGFGHQYLNKPSRLLRYTSEIAYPFYILHQTVIVTLGYYLLPLEAGMLVKYVVISSIALVSTVLLCEGIKMTNITRFLFGMKPKKVSSTQNHPNPSRFKRVDNL
jgi:glucans biosynthesis protein C